MHMQSTGNYLPQMIGMVVALAIRELLSRALRLFKGRGKANIKDPIPWIWSLSILLYVIQFWWTLPRTDLSGIDFFKFTLVFMNPAVIFAACVYVLPDEVTNLRDYFDEHARELLIICGVAIAYASLMNVWIDGEPFHSDENRFRLAAVSWIGLAAVFARCRPFQYFTAISLLAMLGIYIYKFTLHPA
jgi:hypothetical protein